MLPPAVASTQPFVVRELLMGAAVSVLMHGGLVIVAQRLSVERPVPQDRRAPLRPITVVTVVDTPKTPVSDPVSAPPRRDDDHDPAPTSSPGKPAPSRKAKPRRKAPRPRIAKARDEAAEARRRALEEARALPGGGVRKLDPLPTIQIRPPGPQLIRRRAATGVARKQPDGIRPTGEGTYEVRHEDAVAHIAHDGSITFEDPTVIEQAAKIAVGLARINPIPLIHAASGEDSAAGAKLKILKKTESLRASMRDRAERENLGFALRALRPRLREIWGDNDRSVADRRRSLFAAWDECAEEGPAEVVRAGQAAREIVLAFIAKTIPADHPDAFTSEEIEALNRERASRGRFEPYATSKR